MCVYGIQSQKSVITSVSRGFLSFRLILFSLYSRGISVGNRETQVGICCPDVCTVAKYELYSVSGRDKQNSMSILPYP